MFERRLIPLYLPRGVYGPLVSLKRLFVPPTPTEPPPAINLAGDRDVEWAYVASRLPSGTGSVLDFGAGYGTLSMHAIQKGYEVLALDLGAEPFYWSHPRLTRVQGDLLALALPDRSFDYILSCSTVEHVGLAGRYGVVSEESNGDLAAMGKLRGLLKPSGKMVMTVPCGRDAVFAPWHRVYGRQRLPELLRDFEVVEEAYWKKNGDNCWHPTDVESALSYVPTGHPTKGGFCSYALACLVLEPSCRAET